MHATTASMSRCSTSSMTLRPRSASASVRAGPGSDADAALGRKVIEEVEHRLIEAVVACIEAGPLAPAPNRWWGSRVTDAVYGVAEGLEARVADLTAKLAKTEEERAEAERAVAAMYNGGYQAAMANIASGSELATTRHALTKAEEERNATFPPLTAHQMQEGRIIAPEMVRFMRILAASPSDLATERDARVRRKALEEGARAVDAERDYREAHGADAGQVGALTVAVRILRSLATGGGA